MDIESGTSWYIHVYGNQKMATRTILKAVSIIYSLISSLYGVKGSINVYKQWTCLLLLKALKVHLTVTLRSVPV